MASAAQVASTVPKTQRNRFAFLDLMRFLAAVGVVGYHYTAIRYVNWGEPVSEVFPSLSKVTKYGLLGVDLFFLISGFVILMSAYQRPAGQFVASRFSRIFPALWVMIILGALLRWVIWPEKGTNFQLRDFFVNLTLVVEPNGSPYVDGVMWTLWTEMRFYVLIFFFILWGITQQRIIMVSLLWPVTAFLAAQTDSWFLAGVLLPSSAPLFAGGMMMFAIFKWGWSWLKVGVLLSNVAWASMQSSKGAATGIVRNTAYGADDLKLTIAIVLIFVIVGVCVLTPVRSVSSKWMTWLGLFTYPLYLVHELWGWFIIDRLSGTMSKYAVLAVTVLTTFLMAFLIIKFIEKPFSGKMRNRIVKDLERIKLQDDTEKELFDMAQGKFLKRSAEVVPEIKEDPTKELDPATT